MVSSLSKDHISRIIGISKIYGELVCPRRSVIGGGFHGLFNSASIFVTLKTLSAGVSRDKESFFTVTLDTRYAFLGNNFWFKSHFVQSTTILQQYPKNVITGKHLKI